ELIELGARFTIREGDLSLGREGGHSRRRIVRAADLTGREVERALLEAVAAEPAIEIFENHMAVDFLIGRSPDAERRCVGALVLGAGETTPTAVHAKAVMVATGGCGQ